MKVRIGFVSNSSSSSYIVLGCRSGEFNIPDADREEIYEADGNITFFDDGKIFGVRIASLGDDLKQYDMQDFFDKIEKARMEYYKFFVDKGMEVPKPKIFAGEFYT